MYICICVYVYMCICVYVYMFICVYVYICICVCVYVYLCICVFSLLHHDPPAQLTIPISATPGPLCAFNHPTNGTPSPPHFSCPHF